MQKIQFRAIYCKPLVGNFQKSKTFLLVFNRFHSFAEDYCCKYLNNHYLPYSNCKMKCRSNKRKTQTHTLTHTFNIISYHINGSKDRVVIMLRTELSKCKTITNWKCEISRGLIAFNTLIQYTVCVMQRLFG